MMRSLAHAEIAQLRHAPERQDGDEQGADREHETGPVAAGKIVQQPGHQGAQPRAYGIARIYDAVDTRDMVSGKQSRADRGHDRAARALADPENEHESGEQALAREPGHREQDGHAGDAAGEGEADDVANAMRSARPNALKMVSA